MFLILGLVLLVAWIAGFVVFHTAGFLIHILLICAVISVIVHFVRGGKSST
ncbi:MAG TPA: lmo0937 family membrane protein [Terracidiphilus sp.]|nr:lmo0937 family membrane protein [Terracidiphilus sp.]